MSFNQFNLDPRVIKALNTCGYTQPTPIQKQSIPAILGGKDLVASAQTGTGKTAAFVLPALQKLSETKAQGPEPRVVILTPTRELTNQITDAINKYSKFLPCKVVSIVGGMSYHQQIRALSRPVDVIVATPGRLLDHMEQRRINLSKVDILVLDEADRMLDMGFIDDVRSIAKVMPKKRQTLLFSATMDKNLEHLIQKLLNKPVHIDLSQERIYPTQIKQQVYYVDNAQHKTKLLTHFLKNEPIYKAIIFSATKINADDLAKDLSRQGLKAAALHGDMKQGARNRITEQFRRGKVQYLVATDVASRGIDVHDITHVFNYDLPKFFEDYVHRIGRTGRAGKSGIAISFVAPYDSKHIHRIEKFINQKITTHTIEGLEPKAKPQTEKRRNPKRPKKSAGNKKSFAGKAGKRPKQRRRDRA